MKIILLALIIAILPSFRVGATEAYCSSAQAKFSLPEKCGPLSREDRVQYAGNLLAKIERLYNAIPTLSPAEAAWLKKEYDDQEAAGNLLRSSEARKSIEYDKRTAGTLLRSQVIFLRRIQGELLDFRTELYLWTALAVNFGGSGLHESVQTLVVRNVISKDISMYNVTLPSDFMYYSCVYKDFGSMLTQRIVIPMMEKQWF